MGCAPSTPGGADNTAGTVLMTDDRNVNNSGVNTTQTQKVVNRKDNNHAAPPVELIGMEGKSVPDVKFKTRNVDGTWEEKSTMDLFKNKKIVVFSLPGAFTPTCSSTHLPTYNTLAPIFKSRGIDDLYCIAVNDTFVMDAWANKINTKNVTMIPDGTGAFTEGMGMLRDFSALGFGQRSWRYSAYIEDGIVKKMFVEPVKEGDPFEVSDAHTMLKYLFPDARPQPAITIFSTTGCSHCARAKEMLKSKGLTFEEVLADGSNRVSVSTIRAVSGRVSTPQIFIDGQLVGGADELAKYLSKKR